MIEDHSFLQWLAGTSVVAGLIAWFAKRQVNRVDNLTDDINKLGGKVDANRLEAYRVFVTQEAHQRSEGRLIEMVTRMMDSIDSLHNKIDRKADK